MDEISYELKGAGIETRQISGSRGDRRRVRGFPISPEISEIIVGLGSAGAFTAFYKIICKLLEKNKSREFHFVRGNTEIHINGHNILDEKELLKIIAAEFEHEQYNEEKFL